jgi:pSer/pThr/pTyr-binding forkhead associated (FHA) protein
VVTLHGAEWRFGAGPRRRSLLGDSGVSRNHARIVWANGGYVVEGPGSATLPTYNGVKITVRPVVDGDVIQFGASAAFRYALTDADQGRC